MTVSELIKELEKMPKDYEIEVIKYDESIIGFEDFFIDDVFENKKDKKVNIEIW